MRLRDASALPLVEASSKPEASTRAVYIVLKSRHIRSSHTQIKFPDIWDIAHMYRQAESCVCVQCEVLGKVGGVGRRGGSGPRGV